MATNILLLPQLQATFVVANDDDWLDTIPFMNPSGTSPLDITGIVFSAMLRDNPSSNGRLLMTLTTSDGSMTNGGATGLLSFNVPRFPNQQSASIASMSQLSAGAAYLDILASADGHYLNLFKISGPAQVTIMSGLTL